MANPLSGVGSWLYHLGDVSPRKAAAIAASDAGLLVIDSTDFGGDNPRLYDAADLAGMRGGQDRLIVSYLSIGEAETYRPYWKDGWSDAPPRFLDKPNPEWPDNFKVRYWEPEWQRIVLAQVDGIIEAGFNGLYLDIIDGFEHWEAEAPRSGINYRQEMADLVALIDTHATARLREAGDGRDFVIIGQNGEELLSNPTYRAHIDGLAKEDLRFYYPNDAPEKARPVPADWYESAAALLQQAEAAGIEVFVVEYLPKARQAQFADVLAAETAWLHDRGIPLYVAEERDLLTIYDQPALPLSPPRSDPSTGGPLPPEPGDGSGEGGSPLPPFPGAGRQEIRAAAEAFVFDRASVDRPAGVDEPAPDFELFRQIAAPALHDGIAQAADIGRQPDEPELVPTAVYDLLF